MKDTSLTFDYDLSGLVRAEWVSQVDDIAEQFGYSEPMGFLYKALFIDAGRTLLVSFESVASARKQNPGTAPLGWEFVKKHGWSSLTLLAETEVDWYRRPAVYGYFDRMIDDGFFDDFDQVLFYGAGAAGYAAASLSVAAPETRVLAIQPQATLDADSARWDRRFPQARLLDFKTRFGYAPQMVETADSVAVIHDPTVIEDAVHAQKFDGDNTFHMTCPYLGPDAQRGLLSMGILTELIEKAMDGSLTQESYADLWRARRNHIPYLRTLMYRLDGEDRHKKLLARLCRQVVAGGYRPVFQAKLDELLEDGVTL